MTQGNVRQTYATSVNTNGVAIPKNVSGNGIKDQVAEHLKAHVKGLRLTPYELMVIVMTVIVCAFLVVWRMHVQGQHLEMQQAITEYTHQTHNIQAQTAVMENEINLKRNYETIQQAAKDAGMTINRANVKEVSNGTE